MKVDSEYDTKNFDFITSSSVRKSQNLLIILANFSFNTPETATAELLFNLQINPDNGRNTVQALILGLLISGTAMAANYKDLTVLGSAAIVIIGLLAGFASVFKFSQTA